MNKASCIYSIYWGDILVGISTHLYLPSGTIKYAWRSSRLVILPDYQNLGFGTAITEFMGDYHLAQGYKYFMRSSHLRLRAYWAHSKKWVATQNNNKVSNEQYQSGYNHWTPDTTRVCGSYEYMGSDFASKPHKEIYCEYMDFFDLEAFEQDLITLKEKYYLIVITGDIKTENPIEQICMRNGIRTQLLYGTKKGVKTLVSKYKGKEIIYMYNKGDLLKGENKC